MQAVIFQRIFASMAQFVDFGIRVGISWSEIDHQPHFAPRSILTQPRLIACQ